MKRSLLAVFIVLSNILLITPSCKKERAFMNDAILTGYDLRLCACCGGLMITFNGETKPYTGDYKLIENSNDLGITGNDTFPIHVKVDWINDTTRICNHIIVTRFERQ